MYIFFESDSPSLNKHNRRILFRKTPEKKDTSAARRTQLVDESTFYFRAWFHSISNMASEATRRPAAAGRPVGLKARASTVEYMQCHTMYYLLEIYRKETLLSVLCLFPPSPSSLALYTYSYKLKLLLFSRRAREAPERHDTRGKVYIVYIIIIIIINIFHEKNIFTLIYI